MSVLKAILAVSLAVAFFGAAAILFRRTRARSAALLTLGMACFVVVALAHMCEALRLLPAFGWGQRRSIGHYIDLAAALLTAGLSAAGLLEYYLTRRRPPPVRTR